MYVCVCLHTRCICMVEVIFHKIHVCAVSTVLEYTITIATHNISLVPGCQGGFLALRFLL